MSKRRYRFLGRMETGELAELYKGLRDEHESVVVKLFLATTSAPEYARELAETARALSGIRDVGILHEVEIGLVKGRLAVVREGLDGFNLGTALQRLSTKEVLLPPPIALFIVIQLLGAVQRAHEAGIVHGAITPGNVVLSKQGEVAICDFGAIRALAAAPALKPFLSRGRSAYRALEVVQGDAPTEASDVYSLGAIAYELLTLREAITQQATMGTRRDAALPPPSRLDRRLNARLDPIIMRAIDSSPQRRYKTCQDFSGALRNFLSTNGGMPTGDDIRRFVSELFPSELSLILGPAPFTEAFSLQEVSGADLHPDVTGDVALRQSFSGGAAPDLPPDTDARGAMALPPMEEPRFDDGTEPGRAGPLEISWHAPPGSAPARRSGQTSAIPSGSQPAYKTRLRSMEDFEDPQSPPTDERARQEIEAPTTAKQPQVSQPVPEPTASGLSDPSSAFSAPGTGELVVRRMAVRRQKMAIVALAVAVVGAISFALTLKRLGRARAGGDPHPVTVRPPPPQPPLPAREGVQPAPPRPQEEATAGELTAVKLEPTPVEESAPPRPAPRGSAFVTLLSNTPANVYIDGVRIHGKTPLRKVALPPGTRKIVLESVATGERKEFSMTFQRGQTRRVEEHFNLPATYRN